MRRKWKFESGDFDFETAEGIRQKIRDIVTRKQISIRILSAKTGYSDPYLSRLMSGQRRLSLNHLEKLSVALETPITAFEKPRKRKQDGEVFYDPRLSEMENWKMAGMLHEIKEGLVNYFIKKRRKKRGGDSDGVKD